MTVVLVSGMRDDGGLQHLLTLAYFHTNECLRIASDNSRFRRSSVSDQCFFFGIKLSHV